MASTTSLSNTKVNASLSEVAHYVVNAHPPGCVLATAKCNFVSPDSIDVLIAKSGRLEIRQMRSSGATTSTPAVSTMDGQPKINNASSSGAEKTLSTADLANPFPLICSVAINGRITNLIPLTLHNSPKSLVFFLTDRHQYGVLGYNSQETGPHAIETHASGSITAASMWSGAGNLSGGESSMGGSSTSAGAGGWTNDNTLAVLGREAEAGPIVLVDPHHRCIALHLHTGLLAILPINRAYNPTIQQEARLKDDLGLSTPPRRTSASPSCLGHLFHCRIEERTVLSMSFLQFSTVTEVLPHLCVLHQDARGVQHVTTHILHLQKRQLYFSQSTALASVTTEWLRKTAVDGGSAMLLSVPPLTAAVDAIAAASNVATSSEAPTNNQSSSSSSNNASGGVIIVGQRQITYCSWTTTKIIPVPQALYLASAELPPDPSGMPRFLLTDEFGNLHLLTLLLTMATPKVVLGLSLETLGSCNLARDVCYLGQGLVYVASHLGDSQLVQIHDEPIPVEGAASSASGRGEGPDNSSTTDLDADMELQLADTTYIQVLEEYTNLGPILDFDLIPTAPPSTVDGKTTSQQIHQSQIVTCSGSSKMGSLRLVRNGIGMNEYASVDIPGISNMWPLREKYEDMNDSYLIQSFVGETRVLGATLVNEDVAMDGGDEEDESEEPYGSLEEVVLPGLKSNANTLYVCNLKNDCVMQITDAEVLLIGPFGEGGTVLDSWANGPITVATANESGQIAVAQRGGSIVYLKVDGERITKVAEKEMEQEVSCLNLNPFQGTPSGDSMEVDDSAEELVLCNSKWLAVGLWDDYTVRLLNLQNSDKLEESEKVYLYPLADEVEEEISDSQAPGRRNRNTMMARSLCLITLDFSSGGSSGNGGPSNSTSVDMLFVGLGDGSLISFAVLEQDGQVSLRCKKEVCLGTLRIDLVPLGTRGGGRCVLVTGDRPTVIYLAGIGGGSTSSAHFNPKLCYSSVNLSASEDETDDNIEKPPSHQSIAVNVACPFFSPLLSDTTGGQGPTSSQQYSLCVADEACLRLGVIDDIQKLHVTTCRLGMAPRRIVHCADGRLFAVGCMESGIKHLGAFEASTSMGNCIRFMDDTSFDDIQRFDMDPFETILSMAYVTLTVPDREIAADRSQMKRDERSNQKPFLVVGTGYSMADEAEMNRGRILLYSCEADETSASSTRGVRQITELSTNGGVLSICQFFNGSILCAVNSKTFVCELHDDAGLTKLKFGGVGHHGHILSMFVKSRARPQLPDAPVGQSGLSIDVATSAEAKGEKNGEEELLAIVGDLMRSVSVVQYFPEHQILEEIARDFNANWTTAVEMLTNDIYLAGEHWSNLYCLRRNRTASSEEVRCRLDIIGEYHLGEMCNKFMSGSLVMPVSTSDSNAAYSRRYQSTRSVSPKKGESSNSNQTTRIRRPVVSTGSQTLFGSVDGSLGVVLGLDGRTAAFFTTMERAMAKVIRPIGDLSHQLFRAFQAERRMHPAHGFVDGDLIESFLDLDRNAMDAVVKEMNRDGGWEVDDAVAFSNKSSESSSIMEDESPELSVDDVVAMVEEVSMLH